MIECVIQEGMTKGLHRAYGKLEGRLRCKGCGLVLPKYPGRYPANCPHCDEPEFEDLQNSPVYSESDYRGNPPGTGGVVPGPNQVRGKHQFRSLDSRKIHKSMRQVKTDRISLSGDPTER